jgi:protease I
MIFQIEGGDGMFFSPKCQLLVVLPEKDYDEVEYAEVLRACKEAKIKVVNGCVSKGPCYGEIKGKIKPDVILDEVLMDHYHGLMFIGGLGTRDLFNNILCHKLIREALQLGKIVSAIDFGPIILARAEVLNNRKATIHPTEERHFSATGVQYLNQPVVIDGNIITARDKNAAPEFSEMVAGAILKIGFSA